MCVDILLILFIHRIPTLGNLEEFHGTGGPNLTVCGIHGQYLADMSVLLMSLLSVRVEEDMEVGPKQPLHGRCTYCIRFLW
jgi:hypothetical protein